MTGDLSPRAQRYADLLRALNRRKVPLADLWRIFDRADPASQTSLGRRKLLVETLDELAAAGVILLPSLRSYDRIEQPPTPRFVLVELPQQERPDAPHIVWHPELSWADDTPMTAAQREQLAAINAWLLRDRDDLVVPLRERSLEIFHDEKALDAILTTRVFADGRLSLETLRARRVVPPLHTERVGPGSTLLVIENSDTLDSVVRTLSSSPGSVGVVAWGAGAAFEASVLAVARLQPAVTEVRYFGDLDRAGLRIPINADRLAQTEGLPPIQPATDLYDALFQHGKRQAGQQPLPAETAEELTQWLDPRHRQQAAQLLRTGHRMAQEAVGLRYLSSLTTPLAGRSV